VSDTPRTNDQIGYDGSTMTLIRIEFAKQLERELNAARKRIKRLYREIELLRFYGNKDCTAMADEALAKEAKL